MGEYFSIVVLGILVLGLFAVPVSSDVTTVEQSTIEGATIEVDPQLATDLRRMYDSYSHLLNRSAGRNVTVLHAGEEEIIVSTNEPVETGRATLSGPYARINDDVSVMFAESASYQTSGTEVSLASLRSHPERYENRVVRVSGPYRQVSHTVTVSDGEVSQQTVGLATNALPTPIFPRNIGHSGSSGAVYLSGNMNLSRGEAAGFYFLGTSDGQYLYGNGDHRWWSNGNATVDVVVTELGGSYSYRIADVEPISRELSSVDEIDADLEGEVVTVRAQVLGSRLSAQETLSRTSDCTEPNHVAVSDGECVAVPTDVTIHTGVLYDEAPTDRSDLVTYAGLSNHPQSKPLTSDSGTYEVTGRVIATSHIDPELPRGQSLLVYDTERVDGRAKTTAVARRVETTVLRRVRAQLLSNKSTWTQMKMASKRSPQTSKTTTTQISINTWMTGPGGRNETTTTVTTAPTDDEQGEDRAIIALVHRLGLLTFGLGSVTLLPAGLALSIAAFLQRRRGDPLELSRRNVNALRIGGAVCAMVVAGLLYPANSQLRVLFGWGGGLLLASGSILAAYRYIQSAEATDTTVWSGLIRSLGVVGSAGVIVTIGTYEPLVGVGLGAIALTIWAVALVTRRF